MSNSQPLNDLDKPYLEQTQKSLDTSLRRVRRRNFVLLPPEQARTSTEGQSSSASTSRVDSMRIESQGETAAESFQERQSPRQVHEKQKAESGEVLGADQSEEQRLQQRMKKLRSQVDRSKEALQQIMRDSCLENGELQHENQRLQREVGELQSRVDSMNRDYEALQRISQNSCIENGALQRENQELQRGMGKLLSQVDSVNRENDALRQKVRNLCLEKEADQREKQRLRYERGKLQNRVNSENRENEALRRRVQSLESQLNKDNRERCGKEQTIQDLSQQIKQDKKVKELKKVRVSSTEYRGIFGPLAVPSQPARYECREVEEKPSLLDRLKESWATWRGRSRQ